MQSTQNKKKGGEGAGSPLLSTWSLDRSENASALFLEKKK